MSQAAFFGLFLYLLLGAHYTGEDYISSTVQRFFHFDPLLALVTSIAARVVIGFFVFSLITVVVTIVLGRVFCGWVCPFGSVNQFFSFLFKRTKFLKSPKEEKASLASKYYILVIVLVAAVFGLDLAGYLDPFSFLTRSFALSLFPGMAYALSSLGGMFYSLGILSAGRGISHLLETWTINATFVQGAVVGLIFLGVILLNAKKERFWCRYVCPTGALLGLLSRWNLLKLKINPDTCLKCGLCSQNCPTQAQPFPNDKWRSGECIYCFTCASICPAKAIDFKVSLKPEKAGNVSNVSIGRRRLMLSGLVGAAAVPLFNLTPFKKRANLKLLRPPGSIEEEKFLTKCVKCGQCMRACPTNAIQPALTEAGPAGIWTPVLVPRIGYCEYYCSLCSQVCPTGAIKKLTVEEKTKVKIGTAWLDKSRCIPHVLGKPCIVCEEHCPASPKAISLVMIHTELPDGTTTEQKAPFIDKAVCIGCGVCENKCPIRDLPAIRVTSVGEARSSKNRFFLDIQGEGNQLGQ